MSLDVTVKDRLPAGVASVAARPSVLILPAVMVTLFLSAWLLFSIQPMLAKVVLPRFGGSSSVWTTAMLFFQTMLLAGYAYAHYTTRVFGLQRQVLVHLAILAVAFISLPVGVAAVSSLDTQPVVHLIVLLTLSVGLPFFAVSATAPLLQNWFAQSGHRHAHDPYFLYGASNLGGILALLSYPFLVEPLLRLEQQSASWAAGYAGLVVLIVFAALSPRLGGRPAMAAVPASAPVSKAISWRRRALWTVLAFVPSSLLLGVTTQATTDVPAASVLWVLPLVLYLLTFVVVFARRAPLRHEWMLKVQPYAVILAILAQPFIVEYWTPAVGASLLVFFVLAMVCHGELAKRRPAADRLTEFYIFLALGGMLGGVFNALLAPALFSSGYEYYLAIALACTLRPGLFGGAARARILDLVAPGAVLVLILLTKAIPEQFSDDFTGPLYVVFLVAALLLVFSFQDRPLRFGLGVGIVLLGQGLIASGGYLEQSRSFFGDYRVSAKDNGAVHQFSHGTTLHGVQFTDPAMARQPLGPYSKEGPLGQVFAVLSEGDHLTRVGLVGFGAGTVVCYRRADQSWTVYEIDPEVGRIALNSGYFRFVEDCGGGSATRIVYGDRRQALRKEADGHFDLLILDAFSSDSIPVHLLTQEALALYLSKVRRDGVVLFNVSSRHMDLTRVLSALVESAGLVGLEQVHVPDPADGDYRTPSQWVIVARGPAAFGSLARDPRWSRLEVTAKSLRWTDDFSNIIGALK